MSKTQDVHSVFVVLFLFIRRNVSVVLTCVEI